MPSPLDTAEEISGQIKALLNECRAEIWRVTDTMRQATRDRGMNVDEQSLLMGVANLDVDLRDAIMKLESGDVTYTVDDVDTLTRLRDRLNGVEKEYRARSR